MPGASGSVLSVSDLSVDLGGQPVLRGVSLEVPAGDLAVVVGPSGCGKSTLVRAVAGLLRPAAGTVTVGGEVLSGPTGWVPPERRRVGWVPQQVSLFPHLTVAQNVAFGLGPRAGRGASATVTQLLELVGLPALAGRFPDQLSGGQAQRVAIARALAARPRVLLLDEPFAALDPQLRAELREEVRATLHALQVTGVLVTHDQAEALLLADTVVVLRDGAVEQQDPPRTVYTRPRSPWVAQFLGEAVLLDAEGRGATASCELGDLRLVAPASGPLRVMVRPEQLVLGPEGLPAVVRRIRYGGHDALVELAGPDGLELLARVPAGAIPSVGAPVGVGVEGPVVGYPRPVGPAGVRESTGVPEVAGVPEPAGVPDPARVPAPVPPTP